MRTWLPWWCVGWVACGGDDKTTPTGDDDDTPECTVDDDCEALVEICEAGACEPGDRDDAFEDATPLFLGEDQAKAGVLATEGDVDTYAYESPGDEWVSVRTVVDDDAAEAGLDTVVAVHRTNGAIHAEGDDFPVWPYRVTGFDSVLYVYLPEAGTWYVSVRDASSLDPDADPAYGEAFAYSLFVREAFGTREPDSATSPSGTLTLPDGDTILSLGVVLDQPGDVDHLTLETPGDQLLEVWSAPGLDGSEAAPLVRLYDGTTRLGTKENLGEGGYLSWLEARAGSFRLEATDANGGGGPDHWFPLFVRTYEPGDAHPFFADNAYPREEEPNDGTPGLTLTEDPVQTTGGSGYVAFRLQGRVDGAGDVDPYTASVGEGSALSVRCWTERFGSEARLRVDLLSAGSSFATGETPDGEDFYVTDAIVPAGGEIELRVEDAGGATGDAAWYRCALFAQ
jgi:hypothetical protein